MSPWSTTGSFINALHTTRVQGEQQINEQSLLRLDIVHHRGSVSFVSPPDALTSGYKKQKKKEEGRIDLNICALYNEVPFHALACLINIKWKKPWLFWLL